MRRLRFNIANLLLVVLVLGLGFVAVRESNDLSESGIFTMTLVALLVSPLVAIHCSGARRTFWIGFALLGGGYLVLSLVPPNESRLMTTRALAYLDSKVPGRSPAISLYTNLVMNTGIGGDQVRGVIFGTDGNQIVSFSQGQGWIRDVMNSRLLGGWAGTTENFVRIGHSLLALIAAWVGGLLSRRLWRDSQTTDAPTTIDLEGTSPRPTRISDPATLFTPSRTSIPMAGSRWTTSVPAERNSELGLIGASALCRERMPLFPKEIPSSRRARFNM
jgi:hypothetical protein